MEGHGTAKTSTAEKPQGFPKDLAERFEDLGKNVFSNFSPNYKEENLDFE